MEWQARLRAEGVRGSFDDFDLVYHPSTRPAAPPEYVVPGLVGLTFRLRERPQGGHVFVTVIDLPAAVRLGARIGLDAAASVAMVDSHERVHIALQLDGVPEEVEEERSTFVDAVWLSLRHPAVAAHVRAGEFGVVTRIEPGLWEALVDRQGATGTPSGGAPGDGA